MEKIRAFFGRYGQTFNVLGVLAVAALLRLYRISEYLTFLGDEGRDVLVVKRMIVDGRLTLLGPTSSAGGFYLGPLYYYMMAPFLWLFNLDPTGPAVMVALLSVTTVYLIYRLVSRFVSRAAGLAAAALYAVSPLIILQSRSSWNPNVTPFFAVLLATVILTQKGWVGKYRYAIVGLVLGLGVQTHYLFLFLFAVTGIFMIAERFIFRTGTGLRDAAAVVGGVAAGISPLFLFEIRHDFVNTRLMITFLTSGSDTGFTLSHFVPTVVDVLFRVFGSLLLRIPGADGLGKLEPAVRTVWSSAAWLTVLILTAFTLRRIYLLRHFTGIKKQDEPQAGALKLFLYSVIWIYVPVLLFGFYRKGIYDYYFGIVFAAPVILAGSLLGWLYHRTRETRVIAVVSFLTLVLFLLLGSPTRKPPNRLQYQVREIARTAFAATGDAPFNFALITDGNSDHAYRYFFEIWGKPPVTIENKEVDPGRESVTDQLIVICETVDCQPLGHSLWEVAGFGRAEITGSWYVPFVTVYRLVHYEEKTD